MADHPMVLRQLHQRWWGAMASRSAEQAGFELHLTYPGEAYMASETKRQLELAPLKSRVEIPGGLGAYLWDVNRPYSFLNRDHFGVWTSAMRGNEQSLRTIALDIPDTYTNRHGLPGTFPSVWHNVTRINNFS